MPLAQVPANMYARVELQRAASLLRRLAPVGLRSLQYLTSAVRLRVRGLGAPRLGRRTLPACSIAVCIRRLPALFTVDYWRRSADPALSTKLDLEQLASKADALSNVSALLWCPAL